MMPATTATVALGLAWTLVAFGLAILIGKLR
jgi:hypothetical protein